MGFDFLDVWFDNDFFAVFDFSSGLWSDFSLGSVSFDFLNIGLNNSLR